MATRLSGKDYYITLDMFIADYRRIMANARTYNAADTPYYKAANKMENFMNEYISARVVFD
jgi:histone acetyltransferase